jgi:hypothetical protein
MTDTERRFEEAAELAVRLVNDWNPLKRRMRDTIPDLGAQSYDREPSDPVVWCDTHERPVASCHRLDFLCRGIPLEKLTDPTGNGAVSHPYKDPGEFMAHARKAAHHIEEMAEIAGRYKPDDPQLSLEMEEANAKPDGCERCSRLDRWAPRHTANPTDVGGILNTAMLVCQGHYDFIRTRGRLPSEEEDAYYASKGKWPKAVGQVDHLRSGIKTGTW